MRTNYYPCSSYNSRSSSIHNPSSLYSVPTKYLLPGRKESSQVVRALQAKLSRAMAGIARATGIKGFAGSPATIRLAIGARKNMCMRYMP